MTVSVRSRSLPRHATHRRSVWAVMNRWSSLHRQRQELARLDSAALRDIGVSADAASRESSRPFWDAPTHWMDPD